MEISVPRDAIERGFRGREGGRQAGQAGSATSSSNAHVRVAVRDRPGPLTYITRGVYRSRIYESRPTSDTRPRQVGAGRVAAASVPASPRLRRVVRQIQACVFACTRGARAARKIGRKMMTLVGAGTPSTFTRDFSAIN